MDEDRGHDVIVINGGSRGLSAGAYLGMAGRRAPFIDARDERGGHGFWFTHAGYEFDIGLRCTSEPPAQRVTSGRWVSTWNSASSTRPGCCGYLGPIAGPQPAEPESHGHVST